MFCCFSFAVWVCAKYIILHSTLSYLLYLLALFLSKALSLHAKRYPIQTVTTMTCTTIFVSLSLSVMTCSADILLKLEKNAFDPISVTCKNELFIPLF